MTATYWQDRASDTGDTLDGFFAFIEKAENEPAKNYPFRDKFPEPVLRFSDWFVETTKIKPNGHNYKGWIKAFNFCIDSEYSIEDLENAWYHSGEGESFTVTSPFSLLGVAGERKARAERRETKHDPTKSAFFCPVCETIHSPFCEE